MVHSRWCSILPVLFVACGGKKEQSSAAPPPPPPPTTAAPADATPAAIDAAAAPVATGATCEPASFAVAGACQGGGRCVSLYEVDKACVVQLKKEHQLLEPDREILDVAWPKVGGPLYLVVVGGAEGPVWGTLDSPLSAGADAFSKVAWKTEKIGDLEPEGFRFGVETTADGPVLTTCKKWIEDNEEEWHCDDPKFWSIASKSYAKKLGVPAFAKQLDGTAIGKVTITPTKTGYECTGTDGKTTPLLDGPADAPIAGAVSLSDDTYLLVQYNYGSRMNANPAAYATPMRGCEVHPLKGEAIPGPAGFWLHRADRYTAGKDVWNVYRKADAKPLSGADGSPFATAGDVVTWAVP
ncbi:MAG: hypothetical protein SFX73_22090 [Kofleriaceae bacterium]|nr:hypothetical protein [Kofleriaceae bacterium]